MEDSYSTVQTRALTRRCTGRGFRYAPSPPVSFIVRDEMYKNLKSTNLSEMRTVFVGDPFYKLVEHHLNQQSQDQRIKTINATIGMLPGEARELVVEFIDRWNLRAYDRAFWATDTASVFDEITLDAKNALFEIGLLADDEMLFNIFNIIVLRYAYSAYDQPKMREFMGIRASVFPLASAISLLYRIGAGIFMATHTPAGLPMIIGYCLSNLGYLLFGARIIKLYKKLVFGWAG